MAATVRALGRFAAVAFGFALGVMAVLIVVGVAADAWGR